MNKAISLRDPGIAGTVWAVISRGHTEGQLDELLAILAMRN